QAVFVCPTRRSPTKFSGVDNSAKGGGPLDYAAPYFGPVSRNRDDIANSPGSTWGVIVWAEPPVLAHQPPPGSSRTGARDNKIRLGADIPDGTSNTLMMAEKWLRPDQYTGGAWNDDHEIMSGLDQDGLRVADQVPLPDTNGNVLPSDNNPCCDWWRDPPDRRPSPRLGSRFGGAHPGGMNAPFADRAARNPQRTNHPPGLPAACQR